MASIKHPRTLGVQHVLIEDIETEADRQLKSLLKRQLETEGTLHDHITRKKAFTESAVYKPLGEEVSGTRSLEQFLTEEKQNEQLAELRQYGLTEQEIEIYLNADDNDKTANNRQGYGLNPSAHASQLEAIEKKIDSRKEALNKPVRFAAVKSMTRHEMELEQAITHDQDKNRMLSSLTVEKKVYDPSWTDSNHPINHLDAILQEAICKRKQGQDTVERSVVATCAPRPHSHEETSETSKTSLCSNVRAQCSTENRPDADRERASLVNTDNAGAACDIHSSSCEASSKILTVNGEPSCNDTARITASMTDPNNTQASRCTLHASIQPIPKEVILKYKLTTDAIKKLDRFKNYDPGMPNKTLFLKNLASKVTEADLVSLFHRFQQKHGSQIVYRLMKGRMNGQAFVTFDSVSAATEALALVHGYQFKGKPIIIQYGKSRS